MADANSRRVAGVVSSGRRGRAEVTTLPRRRRTFEQRRRWSMVRIEAGKQRWLLLGANAILLVPAVAVLVVPMMPALWRGIVAGALIASSFWMTYGVLLIRTYPVTMGEWGESFTRE